MRRFLFRPGRVLLALAVLITLVTTVGATAPAAGGLGSVDALGGPDSGPILHAVRIADDGTFDRVVFEFFSDVKPSVVLSGPTTNTGFVFEDASNNPIPVAGAFVVGVRMEPAAATYNAANFPDPLYSGPTSFLPTDTANIVQVVESGDFEMVLNWAIGVRSATTPVVHVLSDPTRVVVDIPHAVASPASAVTQPPAFTG
jgi:hypothetical protein